MQQSRWELSDWNISIYHDKDAPSKVLLPKQVHGPDICRVTDLQRGKNVTADAVVTDGTSPAVIRTADCLPLVLVNDSCAAVLHISRMSSIRGLLDAVPDYIDIESLIAAWIGPHICDQHFVFEYEGPEITLFVKKYPFAIARRGGKVHLDLSSVVSAQLHAWGLSPASVIHTEVCTYESNLPSWKRWQEEKGPITPFPEFVTVVEKQSDSD